MINESNNDLKMETKFSLYGLLYLAENQLRPANVKVQNYRQQIRIYLKNAITLSQSLAIRGIDFSLLTNKKEEILHELHELGCDDEIKIETIKFSRNVPDGIKFYSAHFKLDVFNYFSSLESDQYVGLVDLDMIALGEIPACLRNLIHQKIPLFYDISDQVIPPRGHDVIIRDMKKLSSTIFEGRWSGGEFIMGTPSFFFSLNNEINEIYEKYLKFADVLHHQGDEMITSVALENLRIKGKYIADAGTLGIVGRYWSAPTNHIQKSFGHFKNCFLLHLPSDKKFLAKLTKEEAQERRLFLKRYSLYLQGKKLISPVKFIIKSSLNFFSIGKLKT